MVIREICARPNAASAKSLLLGLLSGLLLCACAGSVVRTPPSPWIPDEAWWIEAGLHGGSFVAGSGYTRFVKASHARNLYEVRRSIQEQSGIPVSIALRVSRALNAYATDRDGERVVTLTLALLEAIGDDRDALATSIGHEVAHLYYAHGATRRIRNQPILANSTAFAGINAVNTSFSRYEEREADSKGMEWAIAAGFSPCGVTRTFRILAANGEDAESDPFLSSHPDHQERIERANEMSLRLTGTPC